MSSKSRLVLCTALILLTHTAAAAQKKLLCPAPPPSPFKHSGQIVTSFDPSSGMRTTLEHPRPFGDGGLYLAATFVHQDPRRAARRTMDLIIVSTSKAQRYRDAHDIVLVIDGRAVPLVAPARYQWRGGGQGVVLESVRVTLSQADVNALAGARKVAARLNGAEFELTKNHVESLREMATLMGGSTQRWRAE